MGVRILQNGSPTVADGVLPFLRVREFMECARRLLICPYQSRLGLKIIISVETVLFPFENTITTTKGQNIVNKTKYLWDPIYKKKKKVCQKINKEAANYFRTFCVIFSVDIKRWLFTKKPREYLLADKIPRISTLQRSLFSIKRKFGLYKSFKLVFFFIFNGLKTTS